MQREDDAVVVDRVMAALRVMYGAAATNPTHYALSRWGEDPYSRGSYSYSSRNGVQRDDAESLAKPVAGRLFFAGEATSVERYGYMDGAIETGRREADRVMATFAPAARARL